MSQEKILNIMLRTPCVDLRVPHIAAAADLSHPHVLKLLRKLCAAGLIEQGATVRITQSPPIATYRTAPGITGMPGPLRISVPCKEETPPKRGRKTQHLLEFLHAATVMLVKG